MTRPVIITCAVSGLPPGFASSPYAPVTPEQIANECIAAAAAGAAVTHIHVRNPKTGAPSMDPALYREVVERIRESNTDLIINLTTGPGAMFSPAADDPRRASEESTLTHPARRVEHILEMKPDICSLDIATMNFGSKAFVNIPEHLSEMAKMIQSAEVKPELEVFEMGHIRLARDLLDRGILEQPALFQLCLGIPWGAPATTEAMLVMRNLLPDDAIWSSFGISRWEFSMVAQAVILGGHVRVGLEDNQYLERGKLSEGNAPLVGRAVEIIKALGAKPADTTEARSILGLSAHR